MGDFFKPRRGACGQAAHAFRWGSSFNHEDTKEHLRTRPSCPSCLRGSSPPATLGLESPCARSYIICRASRYSRLGRCLALPCRTAIPTILKTRTNSIDKRQGNQVILPTLGMESLETLAAPLALSRPIAGLPLAVGPHSGVPHAHVAAEVRRQNPRLTRRPCPRLAVAARGHQSSAGTQSCPVPKTKVGRVCPSAPVGSPVGIAARWGQTRSTSGSPAPGLPFMSSAIFHIRSGSCSHQEVTFPVPALTCRISASRFRISATGFHAPEVISPIGASISRISAGIFCIQADNFLCFGRHIPLFRHSPTVSRRAYSVFREAYPMSGRHRLLFKNSAPALPHAKII